MVGADPTPAMLPWHRPTSGVSPVTPPPAPLARPLLPEVLAYIRRGLQWWLELHRHTVQALRGAGRRSAGLRSLVLCAFVDLLVAIVGLFSVAMVVAPVMGI